MWLAEQVELRTSSMTAPESGGRQPRIRRDLNDPLLLEPGSSTLHTKAQFHRSQVLGLFSDLPYEDEPTMTQI